MTLPDHRAIELPLLEEILAVGGEARPRDLYPRMRKHFPEITDADLASKLASTGGSLWTNRIQWARQSLVLKSELYREPRGVWRITPKGEARVKGEPVPEDVIHALEVIHPPPTKATVPSIALVSDPMRVLCERLIRAQKQSSTPKNFEFALADAFTFLGFDVVAQGRSGETDVLLDMHIGSDSYRVVVDAKATHGDKVNDAQINWLAIHQHQIQAQAQHAAIVGIGFSGGNLLKWAHEYHAALIRTADLVELLQMHRETPFSLADLRPLFSTPGPTQQSLQDLTVLHRTNSRHWRLLVEIIELIDTYNRINKAGLLATADNVQLMLFMKFTNPAPGEVDPADVPSTDDVLDALTFLARKAVGILREAPDKNGTYRLVMHADTAVKRIHALARGLEDVEMRSGTAANPVLSEARGPE